MPKLSLQARRRLSDCLHGIEWSDLADDVADAIDGASTAGPLDSEQRAALYNALAYPVPAPRPLRPISDDAPIRHYGRHDA